uniref:Uncharacterized protein n=1 Tax=Lepeophtheirus salmonis TaxID=72036 RepID=A0A0K2V621_LEPSM
MEFTKVHKSTVSHVAKDFKELEGREYLQGRLMIV